MGRKHKAQSASKKKNDKKKPGNAETQKPQGKGSQKVKDVGALIIEGTEGFRLLQQSDESLNEPRSQIAYCIDMEWFIEWQDFVGYQAIWAGMDPTEEPDFAKKRPYDKNGDLLRKKNKTSTFHVVPTTMPESVYYNVIFKPEFDEDQVKLVDQATWDYFSSQYTDLVSIPRPVIFVNEKPHKAIELEYVWLGFLDTRIRSSILGRGEKNSEEDFYEFYRMQIANCLSWEMLEDEWIRFYLHKNYEGSETERDKLRFRVWKIDQTLPIQILINHLNSEIYSGTNSIHATIINQSTYPNNKQIEDYTKSHYKFLLEVVELEKDVVSPDWFLTESPNSNKIGSLCPVIKGNINGICERCYEEQSLPFKCLCKMMLYCSKKCQYQDKRFHNRTCSASFDSESDEEFDLMEIHEPSAVGIDNIGNTCYMNSGLQCLSATKKVREFFVTNAYKEYLPKKRKGVDEKRHALLSKKFAKLLKKMNTLPKPIEFEPWAFKTVFSNFFNQFAGFQQQDTQEFISNVIEMFNEEQIPAAKSKGVVSEEQIEDQEEEKSEGSDDENDSKKDETKENNDGENETYENGGIEMIENMRKDMVSQLFCDTFFGIFRSELNCTSGCGNQVVNFQAFSSISLPIADAKKGDVQVPVYFVRSELSSKIESTKVNLAQITGEGLTVEDLIRQVVVDQLGHSDEILSHLIFSVVSSTQILDAILQRHPQKKAAQLLKECSGASNTKFAVIYELQSDLDSFTDDSTVYSIQIKQANSSGFKGIPRPLIIDHSDYVASIYDSVDRILNSGCSSEKVAMLIENENELNDGELLQLAKLELGFELFLNSKKIPTKKKKDTCFFCKSVCKNCSLAFQVEKNFDEFVQGYKFGDELSFTVSLDEERFTKLGLQSTTFTEFGTAHKKADSGNASIRDCFRMFGEKEFLDEDNKWNCSICKKKQIASKQESVFYGPRYLFIQLKRFKTLAKGNKVKNTQAVNFGEVEDFSEFIREVHPSVQGESVEKKVPLYQLYGVVIHAGSLNEGHYTAYSRIGDVWTYFDDEKTKPVPVDEVINHKNAYLLFYELVEDDTKKNE